MLRLAVLAAVFCAVAWAAYAAIGVYHERDALRQTVATQHSTIQLLRQERAALKLALVQRQEEIHKAQSHYDAAVRQLEETLRNDESSRVWGDMLVPDAIDRVF